MASLLLHRQNPAESLAPDPPLQPQPPGESYRPGLQNHLKLDRGLRLPPHHRPHIQPPTTGSGLDPRTASSLGNWSLQRPHRTSAQKCLEVDTVSWGTNHQPEPTTRHEQRGRQDGSSPSRGTEITGRTSGESLLVEPRQPRHREWKG